MRHIDDIIEIAIETAQPTESALYAVAYTPISAEERDEWFYRSDQIRWRKDVYFIQDMPYKLWTCNMNYTHWEAQFYFKQMRLCDL